MGNATRIDDAFRLWGSFGALLCGALDELTPVLGVNAALVVQTNDLHGATHFCASPAIDPMQLRLEAT